MAVRERPRRAQKAHPESTEVHRDMVSSTGSAVKSAVRKIFSCEIIRAMLAPSEMWVSPYFAAWLHRTTAPPEQRIHPGP